LSDAGKAPNAIDVEVGARIRLKRKLNGISQQSLAGKLGVTFQQVQKYEKGTNRVGASRLSQIATALDVPMSYFFDGNQGERQDDDIPISPARPMRLRCSCLRRKASISTAPSCRSLRLPCGRELSCW
jgi:transcriptional regulator with XRE-family HTH domain